MKSTALIATLALLLTGCVNLELDGGKDASEIVYYALQDSGRVQPASPVAIPTSAPILTSAPASTSTPASTRVLMLVDTQAAAFYDTDNMAFSKQPGVLGYYQFARWSERSGKRFTDLLLARLEQEKPFQAVALTSSNVRSDYLLTTKIVELYHDASQQPGEVMMELRAEIVDLNTRSLVSRKTFKQSVKVTSFDAAGAHQAFNQASTNTLDQMMDWLSVLQK